MAFFKHGDIERAQRASWALQLARQKGESLVALAFAKAEGLRGAAVQTRARKLVQSAYTRRWTSF